MNASIGRIPVAKLICGRKRLNHVKLGNGRCSKVKV